MTMLELDLDAVQMLSPEEAAVIWKSQKKRAKNFDVIQMRINAMEVGAKFSIKITDTEDADKNAELVKAWRTNYNDAAASRIGYKEILPPAGVADDVREVTDPEGRLAVRGEDGKWRMEVPAPVIIRWKSVAHDEKRTVKGADGRPGEVTVKIVTFLHGQIVATETIQHRQRTPREDVTALVPDAAKQNAQTGATAALADARTAKLSKNGKWYAAKQTAPETPPANGTADVSNAAPLTDEQKAATDGADIVPFETPSGGPDSTPTSADGALQAPLSPMQDGTESESQEPPTDAESESQEPAVTGGRRRR